MGVGGEVKIFQNLENKMHTTVILMKLTKCSKQIPCGESSQVCHYCQMFRFSCICHFMEPFYSAHLH